jgi:hypothetical protein
VGDDDDEEEEERSGKEDLFFSVPLCSLFQFATGR